MNKKAMIAVGVLVLAAIVYFAMGKKDNSSTESTTPTQQTSSQTNQLSNTSETSSLKSLVAAGSKQCTYKDGDTEGTVFTSNGKARMDFSSVANGVAMSSHAIMDGETYYSWVDGQPSGFKFSTNQSTTGSTGTNQNVDLDRQVNYNCSNYSADSSKFNLPAGVTFTDFSSFQMPTGN